MNLTERAQWLEVLSRQGWLSAQPDSFKKEIIEIGHPLSFKPTQYIYHAGDDAEGIYGILDGAISVFVFGVDGTPRLATILQSGDWFGIGPFLSGQRRTMTVVARENCKLLHVSLPAIRELCRKDQDASRRIGEISLIALEIAARVASDLLISKSDRRIAATLLRVAGYKKNASQLESRSIRITQNELSELSNCSRAISNKILKQFSKKGWLSVGYMKIKIINPKNCLIAFPMMSDVG